MSTNRFKDDRGYVDLSKMPKGPNGRNLCRVCKTEVPKGRLTFCSKACVHEHKMRTNPSYVRAHVFKRDHGICCQCGVDCERLERIVSAAVHSQKAWDENESDVWNFTPYRDRFIASIPQLAGYFRRWNNGSMWEADHIVPVVEGGGECGLEGYRTLCVICHKRETAELAARRARQRNPERYKKIEDDQRRQAAAKESQLCLGI